MKKILLIEPDAFYADIIQDRLQDEGWDVLHAPSGEQGLRDAEAERPHVILLAIKLSRTDGFEVLDLLKQTRATARIPVIMLTELGSKEDIDHCYGIGCAGYVIKAHHQPEDLIAQIREQIG